MSIRPELSKHDEESGWLFSIGIESWVNEVMEFDRLRGESDTRILAIGLGRVSLCWQWDIKRRERARTDVGA